MVSVDLEKAFTCVPKCVFCWTLRKLDIEECLIHLIQSLPNATWTIYCWSWLRKPSPKSFKQDDPLVIISEWKEKTFGTTWAKPRSWYLGWHYMCLWSPKKKAPVPYVSTISAQTLSFSMVVPVGSAKDAVVCRTHGESGSRQNDVWTCWCNYAWTLWSPDVSTSITDYMGERASGPINVHPPPPTPTSQLFWT